MKIPLRLALFALLALTAAASPNRVLYLGTAERAPRMTAHAPMAAIFSPQEISDIEACLQTLK